MKKTNKKQIPKVRLPKYGDGGASVVSEKRTKNMYGNEPGTGMSTGQKTAIAGAALQGGMEAVDVSQQKGLSAYEKNQKYGNAIKSTETGVVSAINPVFGMIHGAVTMATKPLTAKATQTDEQGNLKNRKFAKADIIGQGFADPMAMIPTMIDNKFSMKNYLNQVEDSAKGKIADQKAQEDAYAQQQNAAQEQQNAYIQNAVQQGIAANNQGGGNNTIQYAKYGGQMKFAMGGMNMQPNAEIELTEGTNSNGRIREHDLNSHKNATAENEKFLEGGTKILSTQLIDKTTGKPHSDATVDTKKWEKIINNPNSTPISVKSAERNINTAGILFDRSFARQEAQKEQMASSAFNRMVKKYGVPPQLKNLQPSRDNESMEQGQSEQSEGEIPMNKYGGRFALGGVQLPYYNTDRNGNPKYTMGGFNDGEPLNEQGLTKPQYQQAQTDSMTLYKSGLGKKENWNYPGFNDAQLRLTNPKTGETPKSLSGKEVTSTGAINNFSGVQQYQKPSMTPWKEYIPEVPKAGVSILNKTKNDSLHPVYDQYIPGIEKSKQKGIVLQYSNGGKMPKYSLAGTTPIIMQDNGAPSIVPTSPDGSMANTESSFKLDSNAIGDKDNNFQWNYVNGKYIQPDSHTSYNLKVPKKPKGPEKPPFNWKDTLSQVANFAAQNAGNIYNLSRYNKPEIETYERAKASYLDNTAAMRDAEQEARRDEYAVRGASGGNAGTYLANRVGLNTAKVMNKDRIRQQYANANAQIGNQNAQFNTDIAMREVIANAQNRARNRSGKGEAIGDIGQNFGVASKAGKQGEMDQNTLELMMKYYNTPEFQKMMKDNKFKK